MSTFATAEHTHTEYLTTANNLSDVANAATARGNLGCGSVSTVNLNGDAGSFMNGVGGFGVPAGGGNVSADAGCVDSHIPVWTATDRKLSNTGLHFIGIDNVWDVSSQWTVPSAQATDTRYPLKAHAHTGGADGTKISQSGLDITSGTGEVDKLVASDGAGKFKFIAKADTSAMVTKGGGVGANPIKVSIWNDAPASQKLSTDSLDFKPDGWNSAQYNIASTRDCDERFAKISGVPRESLVYYNNDVSHAVTIDATFFTKTIIVYNTSNIGAGGGVVTITFPAATATAANEGQVVKVVGVARWDGSFDSGALVVTSDGVNTFANSYSTTKDTKTFRTDNADGSFPPELRAIVVQMPAGGYKWLISDIDMYGWNKVSGL